MDGSNKEQKLLNLNSRKIWFSLKKNLFKRIFPNKSNIFIPKKKILFQKYYIEFEKKPIHCLIQKKKKKTKINFRFNFPKQTKETYKKNSSGCVKLYIFYRMALSIIQICNQISSWCMYILSCYTIIINELINLMVY